MNQPMPTNPQPNFAQSPYGVPQGGGFVPSFGTGAVVWGIVSIIFPFLGLIFGIIALVMGISARGKAKLAQVSTGKSTAGIILGSVGIAMVFVWGILAGIVGLAVSDAMEENRSNLDGIAMVSVYKSLGSAANNPASPRPNPSQRGSFRDMMVQLHQAKVVDSNCMKKLAGATGEEWQEGTPFKAENCIMTGPKTLLDLALSLQDSKPQIVMTLNASGFAVAERFPVVILRDGAFEAKAVTWDELKQMFPDSELTANNLKPYEVFGRTPFRFVSPD